MILLALTLTTAQPIPLKALPWDAIVIVRCGDALGTAFHIGAGRYITAAHVANEGECSIRGEPARRVSIDTAIDIAELSGPAAYPKLEIDCGGFKANKHYLSIGYPPGLGRIELPMIYSAFGRSVENGAGMFVGGDTIPGMSGGPTINEDYRVAGITIQRWPDRARALADTYLCGGKA